jgi:hypothetical protein
MVVRGAARCGKVRAAAASPPGLEGGVMTKLEGELKRAIEIDGKPYTLTLSAEGLKLTEKGRRNGRELLWKDLVSGEAALAVALNASVANQP